jgi:beta-glucosidase
LLKLLNEKKKEMFKVILILSVLIFSTCQSLPADPFIDNLISKMSIEEKCGQMTQITIDTIANCPSNCTSTAQDGTPTSCSCPVIDDTKTPINATKLEEAINRYKVGSILNTAYDRAIKAEIWQNIITTIQDLALKSPLKIPVLYGLDSIHGANYIQV